MRAKSFTAEFLKRVSSWLPGAAAVAIIVIKLLFGTYAYSNATTAPDPSTGHTVSVLAHGRTVYLTQAQVDSEKVYHWSNLVLVVFIALAVVQQIRQRRDA